MNRATVISHDFQLHYKVIHKTTNIYIYFIFNYGLLKFKGV